MAELKLLERVDTLSPSTQGFSVDGGKAYASYMLVEEDDTAPTAEDVIAAITEILGSTTYAAGDGRVQRTPPIAHPFFPWMFASNIPTIQGKGLFTLEDAEDELEVPPLPQFALYEAYEFKVEFTPRQYPIVLDSSLTMSTGSWYNDTGDYQPFYVINEWERYTDIQPSPPPDSNLLTFPQQVGSFTFQSTGAANGSTFQGSPRLFLPDQGLSIKWYQVPYRYITSSNSYITGGNSFRGPWLGRINQNPWNNYPAGSLLYLNYSFERYTPPVQADALFPGGSGVFSTEKLVNITFNFLYTFRYVLDLPSVPPNGNYIAAGHNLLPWNDRKFHYATMSTTSNNATINDNPSWKSFPLEILFYDPDSTNLI